MLRGSFQVRQDCVAPEQNKNDQLESQNGDKIYRRRCLEREILNVRCKM